MKYLHSPRWFAACCLLLAGSQVAAQGLQGDALVAALRAGGHVIVMRHANSPRQLPDAATVNPDNTTGERQLDETGRRDAAALGEALQKLAIPVAGVASSPTYRARETARLAGFADAEIQQELSNEGMQESGAVQVAWLQTQVAVPPVNGNRLLITHGPNINAAFPEHAGGMEEGEALVFDPQGTEGPELIARVKIGAWRQL
jgi:phosphohistidine phosphatase SixA